MMTIRHTLFAAMSLLMAGFALAGCTKEAEGERQGSEVDFTAGFALPTRTTSGGDHWLITDEIGIFMLETGGTLPDDIVPGGGNAVYKPSQGNTASAPLNPAGTPLYWKNTGSYDFAAYYPWKDTGAGGLGTPDYSYPVDVSDQEDPAALDILHARNNGKSKGEQVAFTFSHKMAKIRINIVAGGGTVQSEFDGTALTLTGMPSTAKMSIGDGTISDKSSVSDIGMKKTAAGSGYAVSLEAIVIPQAANEFAGRTVEFTFDDLPDMFWNIPDGDDMTAGMVRTYDLKVSGTEISLITNSIAPWEGTEDPPVTGDTRIRYKVGDYYPDPNVQYDPQNPGTVLKGTAAEGIVFWLDPLHSDYNSAAGTGTYGKIVSIEQCDDKGQDNINDGRSWGSMIVTGATNTMNGLANMAVISEISNWDNNFHAFAWVHNVMNGGIADYNTGPAGIWYLPAIEELLAVYNAFRENTLYNEKLKNAGGEEIILLMYSYWSSTEAEASRAWTLITGWGKNSSMKNGVNLLRAVKAFGKPEIRYKVGDYWPDREAVYESGTLVSGTAAQGVVCWLDRSHPDYSASSRSGSSGLIVSLDDTPGFTVSGTGLMWGPPNFATGATSVTDGLSNMKTVFGSNSNSFDNYPAFKWVHELNSTPPVYATGAKGIWYLPAKEEWKAAFAGFSGVVYEELTGWDDMKNIPGNGSAEMTAARAEFNTMLTDAGGEEINATDSYWSSTETSASSAYGTMVNGFTYAVMKNGADRARAVMAF